MTRPARPARSAPILDIVAASARWKHDTEAVKKIMRRAIGRAAAATLSTTGNELAIVLTDDSGIRLLNRDWRGIDAATNVLSFAAKTSVGKNSKAAKGGEHLGDIVLAYETIAREARSECKPFAHHVAHLAVHGFLHLVGYDHETAKEAAVMERTERDILRQLAIPDPYWPPAKRRAKRQTRNPL
jgi:probable rRNA maturation factor